MKIKLFTIPNLLTLSNLLCGMIATVAILTDGDLHLAFWLLVLAAVFDFFDGFTARLLHQSSPIGLQPCREAVEKIEDGRQHQMCIRDRPRV